MLSFFFNDTATTEIYTLSLHDALPIWVPVPRGVTIRYLNDLKDAIEDVGGFPIVLKPLDGNHGRGITLDIDRWETAEIGRAHV